MRNGWIGRWVDGDTMAGESKTTPENREWIGYGGMIEIENNQDREKTL